MAENQTSIDEAVGVGTSAASHLKSMKTAAALFGAAKGAALGPFGAAIGAAIQNRHTISKVIIVIIALLMLPVLFIVMLPGLIFGSLTEHTGALNSNTLINENIRTANQAIVEVLEESHQAVLSDINAAISRLSENDTASINDPYAYSISVNANQLIAQFCEIGRASCRERV